MFHICFQLWPAYYYLIKSLFSIYFFGLFLKVANNIVHLQCQVSRFNTPTPLSPCPQFQILLKLFKFLPDVSYIINIWNSFNRLSKKTKSQIYTGVCSCFHFLLEQVLQMIILNVRNLNLKNFISHEETFVQRFLHIFCMPVYLHNLHSLPKDLPFILI